MLTRVILLGFLLFLVALNAGCGDDNPVIPNPQPTTIVNNQTNLSGYVYVVDNQLLITNNPITDITTKSFTTSAKPAEPVQNCKVKTDGQETTTDENGQFEFTGLSEGEKFCDFDPSESNNAQDCPPVRENFLCSGQQNQYSFEWQNYRIQVVPRKRAQHVGQPKQYRINSWHLGNPVNIPPGLTLEWYLIDLQGTVDSQGIFTPSAPTPKKFYGRVCVNVLDPNGNNINNLVFEDPSHAYSQVKVLGDDPSEIGSLQGKVTKITNIIISQQTSEPIQGATVALDGIDQIGITDTSGNYLINNIPPDLYSALMNYQSVSQSSTVEVIQPSTTLDFQITEDIIITPTPTPTITTPSQPTPVPVESTPTPIPPTPTTVPPTPTNTPTATPTPYWHHNPYYTGGVMWFDIDYTDSNNLAISGETYCLVTTNGGQTWTLNSTGADSRSITMISNSDILISSAGGNVLKSTNGGTTWTSVFTGTGAVLSSIFTLSGTTWTAGNDSQIRWSSDTGTTWNGSAVTGFTISVKDVEFVNSTTGFVCGLQSSSGAIHKTINGGTNWTQQTTPTIVGALNSLCFIGSTALSCGNGGVIIKSTDTGANWTNLNQSVSTVELHSIDMVDANVGWAVGNSGVILYTTNGGTSWIQQESFTSNRLKSVIALSGVHAWAVGDNGDILEYY